MHKNLLMPFTDSSESFTNGFECGQIWEHLQRDEYHTAMVVHSANCEQIKLICEHFGYDFTLVDNEDGWHIFSCRHIDISGLRTP